MKDYMTDLLPTEPTLKKRDLVFSNIKTGFYYAIGALVALFIYDTILPFLATIGKIAMKFIFIKLMGG